MRGPKKLGPPPGFDYADLWELLDLIESLRDALRAGTFDEEPGETALWHRAGRCLERYRRPAT